MYGFVYNCERVCDNKYAILFAAYIPYLFIKGILYVICYDYYLNVIVFNLSPVNFKY